MFDGPPASELDPAERRARLAAGAQRADRPRHLSRGAGTFRLGARAACARPGHGRADAEIAREEAGLGARRRTLPGDRRCRAYPAALAALPDAPPVLSAIGDLGLLAPADPGRSSARAKPRLAGRRFAADLAADLGAAGFVVASGLARGIDAAAHEAALATGYRGRAGRRHRPDLPAAERRPACAPSPRAACCSARSPLGTPPVARAFPRRNRIVSGLSAGVVVIEAADRSGSLITAQRAARAGPRGVRRAGLADGPALCRIQYPYPGWGHSGCAMPTIL